jgi:2-polyprenyl-3-methyl-5-hydroxy-6-metoxy-1,4-benzoquinol methylase
VDTYTGYFEANKELWNQRTMVHKESSFYDLAGFKAGASVLNSIELNELGEVKGKKMLHLQCHFGMDSLDWSRRGADVTGVDLSDEAIKEARRLNDELGLAAKIYLLQRLRSSSPKHFVFEDPSRGSRVLRYCFYFIRSCRMAP